MLDIRYAFRLLRKSPMFTVTVVAILAIGIGATTAIFSVVNAVLLRPLPFEHPERLMQIAEKNDRLRLPAFAASALNYLSWSEAARSFDGLAAIQFNTYTLSGKGEAESYTGFAVTPSLLPVLGLRPALGRGFSPSDDRVGAAPVAMISDTLWKRRFGGAAGVVGQTAVLNGVAYTIIGIAPQALTILGSGDVWVPLVIDPAKEIRLNHTLFVVGRVKTGVTRAEAQAEMNGIAGRLGQQYPEIKEWGVNLITFTDTFVSAQLRTALLVLLGAVVFVLLIVSANVANLLLARALERQKEMAIRAALGAGRGRIVRQLLIESVVLSTIGGLLGLLVATWGVGWLQSTLPPNVLPVPDIGLDPNVVAFAAGVTGLTGLVFGLAPAWQAAGTDVNTALKDAGRSATGARRLFRKSLAAAELALATVLLVGAALLVRSLLALQRVPLGFEPDRVITMQVSLPPGRYPMPRRIAFYRELAGTIGALPGVTRASITSGVPFGAGNYTQSPFMAPGSPVLPADASVPIDWRTVTPKYFATMGIPLLRGRDFTDADTTGAPEVMIVSRATARALWGDADPIGRTVRRPNTTVDFTVVGVVGDVRSTTLNRESPTLYFSAGTRAWALMDIVIRAAGDPSSIVAAVRQAVRALDPEVPISNVRPLDEWVSSSAAQPRLNATLLTLFACVALLVAAVGTYGVLAYSVSQRTRELGLRMALGADRGGVLRLVVREGMLVGLAGILAGIAAAALLGRAVSALVFGVSVWDPVTYAGVSAVLGVVAFAACVMPAIRASRVDPMVALRLE
jgi:putative ABC transport system permease protein